MAREKVAVAVKTPCDNLRNSKKPLVGINTVLFLSSMLTHLPISTVKV